MMIQAEYTINISQEMKGEKQFYLLMEQQSRKKSKGPEKGLSPWEEQEQRKVYNPHDHYLNTLQQLTKAVRNKGSKGKEPLTMYKVDGTLNKRKNKKVGFFNPDQTGRQDWSPIKTVSVDLDEQLFQPNLTIKNKSQFAKDSTSMPKEQPVFVRITKRRKDRHVSLQQKSETAQQQMKVTIRNIDPEASEKAMFANAMPNRKLRRKQSKRIAVRHMKAKHDEFFPKVSMDFAQKGTKHSWNPSMFEGTRRGRLGLRELSLRQGCQLGRIPPLLGLTGLNFCSQTTK